MKTFKKSYWKIPFIDGYIILSGGYPKEGMGNYDRKDYKDYLTKFGERYKGGMWTPDINELICDLKFAYEQSKIK